MDEIQEENILVRMDTMIKLLCIQSQQLTETNRNLRELIELEKRRRR